MAESEYDELCELIRQENPYPDATYSGLTEEYAGVERDGPAAINSVSNPLGETDRDAIKAHPEDCIWWYFEGAPRKVTKAIRVPYTYVVDGKTVIEHLLIGYEGMGP